MLCGSPAQALPSIANVYPNGTNLFQPSPTLTFTASSGVTNVVVNLTAQDLYTGGSLLSHRTSASGLTIVGSNVSAPLLTNKLYSVNIAVYDATGSVTNTVAFDTIAPAYTWEAEDWDYTSNGIPNLYIDNPQTNAYAGLATTTEASGSGGPGSYRPVLPSAESTETTGTPETTTYQRLQYIGTGMTDYDVGWTDGGEWGNYTRHYPAGTYNLFARVAGGNNPQTESADISVVGGTATISSGGSSPYKFGVKGRGWQNYDFMPVTDNAGNLIQITFDGSPNTLRVLQVQASDNMNFFMLMPLAPVLVSTVTITNVSPDGSVQFQATNAFSFNASSPVDINPGSDVTVQLAATNLFGAGSVSVLSVGGGLSYTGDSTNIVVTGALTTNMVYTMVITVNDANGVPAIQTAKFDTIIPAYTFEAEDWNYGGGNFFDNPQTNAYTGHDGVDNVDDSASGGLSDYNRFGMRGSTVNEIPRVNRGSPDFVLDNTVSGEWGNYTRHYPAGTYNIFVRVSRGDNGAITDGGKISLVTGDITQPNQSTSVLGKHNTPSTGNWGTFAWVPIMNSGGYPARFIADGTAKTLRYTLDNASGNVGFFMLIPADLSVNPPPFVSDFMPDGSAPFQYTNLLAFTANSSVGISTSNIKVNIDGTDVSGLTFSGSSTAWAVSFPIAVNTRHTVIVTLTDSVGTTYTTNSFDTFDPSSYTFEVEDYDYSGGLFVDNPQIGGYAGLGSVLNVDDNWDYNVGAGYRPSSGARDGLATESPSGDFVRPGYSTANYDVGHNDGGNWANYTRNQPAGTYNIWMRYASPNGNPTISDAAKISLVTGGWGSTSQTTTALGVFNTRNTGGWGNYNNGWAPLVDANGNYVKWTASGSTNTLRYTVDSGGFNLDFFALIPADTGRPTLGGLYPNGLTQFQGTNTLSFNAISSQGISTNSIVVLINGLAVSNLVFTGSSTNWHVSYPYLQANSFYSVSISFTSLGGGSSSTSFSFDTFAANNYQWECEDWDYTTNGVSGLFFDNPQVDAYANHASTEGIDVAQSNISALGNPFDYRPYDNVNLTPAQEPSGDSARPQFGTTNTDYKLDWFGYGTWCNYTRHYPAGTYNVIGRFTEGGAATVAILSKVTGGFGGPSQTTVQLGTFFIPLGNWSTASSVYLRDNSSNLVTVTFDGSQTTLRLSGNPVAAGDPTINAGYLMLVPVPSAGVTLTATISGGDIHISFLTKTGSNYQLQYKNNLTDASWISLGSPISGNGAVQSVDDPLAGNSHRFYRVQVQ